MLKGLSGYWRQGGMIVLVVSVGLGVWSLINWPDEKLFTGLCLGFSLGFFIGAFWYHHLLHVVPTVSASQNKAVPAKTGSSSEDPAVTTLYVGNLEFSLKDAQLRTFFEPYGTVKSARLMMDHRTSRPRGFGFVERECADIQAVLSEVDGIELGGRKLRVSVARDKKSSTEHS
jgi:hypothetical protein